MSTNSKSPTLSPRLIVAGAARAIDFYKKVFGATEVVRFADEKLGGLIVHAEISIGDAVVTLAEENREWHNHAPSSLGGSPVILTLHVSDAHAVGARLERAGAKVIFPISDHFYGAREGRFVDPFGHVWVITQEIEKLSTEEIQRRVDAYPSLEIKPSGSSTKGR
jgi:PhnB protein